MSYVFGKTQEFETEVEVKKPTDVPNQYDVDIFYATFERPLLDDLMKKYKIIDVPESVVQDNDLPVITLAELTQKYIKGWREVYTSPKKQMKFSKANLSKVMKDPLTRDGLVHAFVKVLRGSSLTERLVKNSEKPELTG